MKTTLFLAAVVYIAGFGAMFWMHTQMPVTFGLALARSAAWPFSLARHEMWPKGAQMTVDCDGPDCG